MDKNEPIVLGALKTILTPLVTMIKKKVDGITSEELLDLLVEVDAVQPVVDSRGAFFTDSTGRLYIL